MAYILLIEDNLNNAEYAIRVLGSIGHQVEHHVEGLVGERAARQRRPDLILLDLNLPDIDGNVLNLSLRKSLGGSTVPPIVALTAQGSSVGRQTAEKMGFDAYIGKPFEPEELIDVVETLLRPSQAQNR